MLTHAAWRDVPGLRHGFLEAADCAAAPDWAAVAGAAGAPLPLVVPRQVHGTVVVTAVPGGARPEADAVVAATPGVSAAVMTADCVPVLLADRRRRIVAAVHAGWRGASAGVIEAAIAHLQRDLDVAVGALEAVVGPAIGPCCYVVGPEVRQAFVARTGAVTDPAWSRRGDRDVVDLRLACRLLLEHAGVGAVGLVGRCSSCEPGFHSYRRDGAGAGRQLSFIGWAA